MRSGLLLARLDRIGRRQGLLTVGPQVRPLVEEVAQQDHAVASSELDKAWRPDVLSAGRRKASGGCACRIPTDTAFEPISEGIERGLRPRGGAFAAGLRPFAPARLVFARPASSRAVALLLPHLSP
jgi:hypothetical protein